MIAAAYAAVLLGAAGWVFVVRGRTVPGVLLLVLHVVALVPLWRMRLPGD